MSPGPGPRSLKAHVTMSSPKKMSDPEVPLQVGLRWRDAIEELSALADRMVEMGDRAAAERLVTASYMVGDMVAAIGLCQTTS